MEHDLDVFPDMEDGKGCIIPMFAVFKKDGTAVCVQPQKTFAFFIHPDIDMEELNTWLQPPKKPIPPTLEQPLHKLKQCVKDDRPIIVSNGRSEGYIFMGKNDQWQDILYKIWGHVFRS